MSYRAESGRPRRRSLVRIYFLEAKYEFLKLLRMPAFALPTIGFPVLFYVLFGLSFRPPGGTGSTHLASYLIASYGAFGVIGTALFGFGVGVAVERGQGWLLLKRATPMPPLAYFVAKMLMSLAFGLAIVLLLCALGAGFGDVRLPAGTWLGLIATLAAGAIPFSAMGLALGLLCGPNSAPAVVNLIYLPTAFASGLWIPLTVLPGFFRKLAPVLPPYHLGQLALKQIGADLGAPTAVHLAVLAGFAAVSVAFAVVAFRRDEGRTYG